MRWGWVWIAIALGLSGCSAAAPEPTQPTPGSGGAVAASSPPVVVADAPAASQEEQLAAIQRAMNELDEAAQSCWAAAAVERFDIEGDVTAQIEILPTGATASIVKDSARHPKLAGCVTQLLGAYRWAPPLHGQTIQLPFRFRAPDGQSVIDRKLVPWHGQGQVSIAVLLDESNTGNPMASMIEIAIAAGGATGPRLAERAEVWYFFGPAQVTTVEAYPAIASRRPATMIDPPKRPGSRSTGLRSVDAGAIMYVPAGAMRDVRALQQDMHAMIVVVPGGREGAARAGALSTPAAASGTKRVSVVEPSNGRVHGPVTIYIEPGTIGEATLAASIIELPTGAAVPEHVHATETELLYVLAGSGTMTVNGVQLAVSPTSVIQVPPGAKHSFAVSAPVRAVQIYTPAGPEQRFKTTPKAKP